MSCPVCRKPTAAEYRPFCSKRCADLDLARWLRGDYAIPVGATDEEKCPSLDAGREGEAGEG